MKKIKILIACASLITLGLVSCNVEDLNTNLDEPIMHPDLAEPILAGTVRGGLLVEADSEQRIKELQLDFYAQVAIDAGRWSTKNYTVNDEWNERGWNSYLSTVFTLTSTLKSIKEDSSKANLAAWSRIWRVYIHSLGCDKYGPMPFITEEELGNNPPYRSVKDIYTEYFSELDAAVKMFTTGGIFSDKAIDVIYSNDVAKWKKFANSLRLRLALRLSEVDPETCKKEAAAALVADGGLIESAADNTRCAVKNDGSWGQDYNYVMFQISWGTPINMSQSFERLVTGIGGIAFPAGLKHPVTKLSAVNHPDKVDPRAVIMFASSQKEEEEGKGGNWKGIKYAPKTEDQNAGEFMGVNYSEMGYIYDENGKAYSGRPYDLLLAEEVAFLKAEAYLRGFLPGGDAAAKQAYEDGIKLSFATWKAEGVDTYLASAEKNYAGTSAKWEDAAGAGNTKLEKIITQKYIAGCVDLAQESWSDKRRLNLPRFDVAIYRDPAVYGSADTDVQKPGNYIQRMQYPSKEVLINNAEYNVGVKELGVDNVGAPIWWASKKANYCTSAN